VGDDIFLPVECLKSWEEVVFSADGDIRGLEIRAGDVMAGREPSGQLAFFFSFFNHSRIQPIGRVITYLLRQNE